MIVGVDHLALSVARLDEPARQLQQAGWQHQFSATGLPNARAKQPLLQHYQPSHDIALLQAPQPYVGLELTTHGAMSAQPGPYLPLLPDSFTALEQRQPSEAEQHLAQALPAIGLTARPANWPQLQALAWQSDQPRQLVILLTRQLSGEAEFWQQALGWHQQAAAPGWAWLKLNSPVANWRCELLLVASESASPAGLDACGGTCLAMYSTALEQDLHHAQKQGATWLSEPFELSVNQRRLRIALLRTPGQAICELIHVVS